MALKPVKVSQLNSYIKRVLQNDPVLGNVSVIGEISNLKFHGSGHVYFSLKDDGSTVSCFLPSGNLRNLDFELKEGLEVTVFGYIYLYERGGRYSINIRDMEPVGKGDLSAAFERLKQKLQEEGLFDASHKKTIPTFPHKIAVVTSETGAAVKDILKTIKQKNDYVDILICPVLVQGPDAPGEIAAAIDDINKKYSDVDIIITGRGGGSAEELWAFNEEIVARSIFASKIPVISAVGHETDFTIADFVADLRAATPTAAAEAAVPDTDALREYLSDLKRDMKRNIRMVAENRKKHLQLLNPENFGRDIKSRIAMEQLHTENIMRVMEKHVSDKVRDYRNRLAVLYETLDAANPKSILKKGYSVVTDEKGCIVRDASVLLPGHLIRIEAAFGSAMARVTESGKEKKHE